MRQCADCGRPIPNAPRVRRCKLHEATRQQQRNGRSDRTSLYGGDWPAESRAIREAHPWCSMVGCTRTDLTVDHPTRAVLCRVHHARLENGRRHAARTEERHTPTPGWSR